jgi:hypothetical protein
MGILPPLEGTARATALINIFRDSPIVLPSKLETATAALGVVISKLVCFKRRFSPPTHPCTAWVLSVSIV